MSHTLTIIYALIAVGILAVIYFGLITVFGRTPEKKISKYPLKKEGDHYPSTYTSKGHLICPLCGNTRWYEGPEGGGSQNMQCGHCLTHFNYMGPFGLRVLEDRSKVLGIAKPKKKL